MATQAHSWIELDHIDRPNMGSEPTGSGPFFCPRRKSHVEALDHVDIPDPRPCRSGGLESSAHGARQARASRLKSPGPKRAAPGPQPSRDLALPIALDLALYERNGRMTMSGEEAATTISQRSRLDKTWKTISSDSCQRGSPWLPFLQEKRTANAERALVSDLLHFPTGSRCGTTRDHLRSRRAISVPRLEMGSLSIGRAKGLGAVVDRLRGGLIGEVGEGWGEGSKKP